MESGGDSDTNGINEGKKVVVVLKETDSIFTRKI
jgi:hypothetical protein